MVRQVPVQKWTVPRPSGKNIEVALQLLQLSLLLKKSLTRRGAG